MKAYAVPKPITKLSFVAQIVAKKQTFLTLLEILPHVIHCQLNCYHYAFRDDYNNM